MSHERKVPELDLFPRTTRGAVAHGPLEDFLLIARKTQAAIEALTCTVVEHPAAPDSSPCSWEKATKEAADRLKRQCSRISAELQELQSRTLKSLNTSTIATTAPMTARNGAATAHRLERSRHQHANLLQRLSDDFAAAHHAIEALSVAFSEEPHSLGRPTDAATDHHNSETSQTVVAPPHPPAKRCPAAPRRGQAEQSDRL